jgi:acyl-CoA hydrolase
MFLEFIFLKIKIEVYNKNKKYKQTQIRTHNIVIFVQIKTNKLKNQIDQKK